MVEISLVEHSSVKPHGMFVQSTVQKTITTRHMYYKARV